MAKDPYATDKGRAPRRTASEDTWGRNTARERYGAGFNPSPNMRPSDSLQKPQCPEDQHGPGYSNPTPENWLRGANEDATTKPGFDRSKGRKR